GGSRRARAGAWPARLLDRCLAFKRWRPALLQGRGGSLRCIQISLHRPVRPLLPDDLRPPGRRSETDAVRRGRQPRQLGRLIAGAVLLTLVNSVQDHLALSGRQGRDPFGYRFVHMLPPWLIAALLVPAVVVVVRRWPLQLRIRSVLLHGAMSVA